MTDSPQLPFADLYDRAEAPVPGLVYRADFITERTERDLVEHIDGEVWMDGMSRRVQHYGWRYDYKARRVTPEQYLGPLPAWLDSVGRRIAELGLMSVPDQVIVNEYEPGQGIAAHTDCIPCFGPTVAMVSLAGDVQMDFESPDGDVVPRLLRQRSLVALSGPARSSWKHRIAKRRVDPLYGTHRHRRISLTFRTVVLGQT
ncbi:MAG TPA: alpha-ketoglutarate-dependent dioxygenase AlkB [Acidimicrobiales bacterium]|nr:alpha-ketoglutarate-dependent dioxygenase AlkB [Acidimicrobiales bacterium]